MFPSAIYIFKRRFKRRASVDVFSYDIIQQVFSIWFPRATEILDPENF